MIGYVCTITVSYTHLDVYKRQDLDSEEDDSKLKETKHIKELTSEQKAIFSYFIPVKGMEDQICKAYNAVLDHFNRKENASTGNLIIQGEQGCGKKMCIRDREIHRPTTHSLSVIQQETSLTERVLRYRTDRSAQWHSWMRCV